MGIHTIVYFILFTTPLVFLPGLVLGFELPKLIVFQICTLGILFLFFHKFLQTGKVKIYSAFKNRSIKRLLFIVLAIVFLSTIFSIAPRLSFWGSFHRILGTHTYLFLIIFFILTSFTFVKKRHWEVAYQIIFNSFLFAIFYGLLQFINLDPIGMDLQEISLGRVVSSFGHPNYMATFLIFTIFPLISYFKVQKKPVHLGISVFLCLFGIIITGSRAALIAFVIAAILYLVLSSIKSSKKGLLIGSATFLLVISTSLIYLNTHLHSQSSENGILERFSLQEDDRSLQSRVSIWKPALISVEDNLFFGSGFETFSLVYAQHMDPQIYQVERITSIPDKAHNSIVEILVENGLLGLLAYIFCTLAVFVLGIRALFKVSKEKRMYLVGVLSAFTAGITANMLGFFSITHFVYLAFFFANFLYLISENISQKTIAVTQKRVFKYIFYAFLVIFIVSELVLQNIFPLLANYYGSNGIRHSNQEEFQPAAKNLTLAASLYPDQNYYYYFLADIYSYTDDLEKASINIEKAGKYSSFQDSYYYLLKGKIQTKECYQNQEECAQAEETLKNAASRAPNYAPIYLQWGVLSLIQDDCKSATAHFDKYLEIIPDFWQKEGTKEYRLFYKHNPTFDKVFEYQELCGFTVKENKKEDLST